MNEALATRHNFKGHVSMCYIKLRFVHDGLGPALCLRFATLVGSGNIPFQICPGKSLKFSFFFIFSCKISYI